MAPSKAPNIRKEEKNIVIRREPNTNGNLSCKLLHIIIRIVIQEKDEHLKQILNCFFNNSLG